MVSNGLPDSASHLFVGTWSLYEVTIQGWCVHGRTQRSRICDKISPWMWVDFGCNHRVGWAPPGLFALDLHKEKMSPKLNTILDRLPPKFTRTAPSMTTGV
ncbi:hypothetical protein PoB_005515100 [Plakobranchus ocellatus]|uniref:Uncharacterized protein n=1 Tax=Plakobranchus ocellatus TaxID=259542 RepID=A0AAV4BZV2_9GAST|nr:hypothetical protein PoB_005515100 [Plakobranchus ocellatus]